MSAQYSVYARPRPHRVAFLIDPRHVTRERLNEIFAYSISRWGGRYHPIVPTDGQTIAEPYQRILQAVDPDTVIHDVALGPGVVEFFSVATRPALIEAGGEHALPMAHVAMAAPEWLTTDALLDSIAQYYEWPRQRLMSIVVCDGHQDTATHDFILRNFGLLSRERELQMDRGEMREVVIARDSSLEGVLSTLAKARRPVCPVHVCGDYARPQSGRRVVAGNDDAGLWVAVGDDTLNCLLAWNSVFPDVGRDLLPGPRSHVTGIWLPSPVARLDVGTESIGRILGFFAHELSGSHPRIRVYSVDWNTREVDSLCNRLRGTSGLAGVKLTSCTGPVAEFPDVQLIERRGQRVVGRATLSSAERTQVVLPAVLGPTPQGRGAWMVDVAVEHSSRVYASIDVQRFWHLPHRFGLPRLFRPDDTSDQDRLTADGGFAFAVTSGMPVLTVRVPGEHDVWRYLLSQQDRPPSNDPRRQRPKSFVSYALSDKGTYLQGALGLFQHVGAAAAMYSSYYWRTAFQHLSGLARDEEVRRRADDAFVGWIRKKSCDLARQLQGSPEDTEAAARQIAAGASRYLHVRETRAVQFKYFEQLLNEHQMRFRASDEGRGICHEDTAWQEEVNEAHADLERVLGDLVQGRALLRGLRPRCPSCKLAFWQPLTQPTDVIKCPGCLHEFVLPPEQPWYYQLNSLLSQAYAQHGIMPVIWTLAALERQAREFFMFLPSARLLSRYDPSGAEPEVDILAILDGQLIAGEVKTKAQEFGPDDLVKLADVGQRIGADRLVLAAVEGGKLRLEKARKDLQNGLGGASIPIDVLFASDPDSDFATEPDYSPSF